MMEKIVGGAVSSDGKPGAGRNVFSLGLATVHLDGVSTADTPRIPAKSR
jgi:hypothetical protein